MAGQIEKELQTKFNILVWHLGFANTHLHYCLRLEESRKKYGFAFLESYDFWEYTKRAHLETATLYLCRVYDKEEAAFRLYRFLNEIPKDSLSEEEKHLLQADKKICQKKSVEPSVEKLRHWRDNFGVHFNYRLTTHDGRVNLSGLKSKKPTTPSLSELQQLIDKGFEILERWASFYKSSPDFQKLIKNKDDYSFVLDAIQTRRKQMRAKNNSLV